MKYILKIGLFVLFLTHLVTKLSAQNDRVIRIGVAVNAASCKKWCSDQPIKTAYLCFNNANKTKIADIITNDNFTPYDVLRFRTVAYKSTDGLLLRWYDPTGGGWQERDLTKNTTPNPIRYHHNDGNNMWHSVWLHAEFEIYDPVKIEKIEYSNCSGNDCGGDTQCISNPDGNLNFTLSVQNPKGPKYVTINAYDSKNNKIGSVYCGSFDQVETILFSSLGLDKYYGKDITFETQVDYTGGELYLFKKTDKPKKFFKQIPSPGTIQVQRLACAPYTIIKVPLDASVIQDINNFKFRTVRLDSQGTPDPKVDNIARLVQYESISNNTIKLIPYSKDASILNDASSGDYVIQIYDGRQNDMDNGDKVAFGNIQCAVNANYNIPSKKEQLIITASPVPKKDFKNVDYHISENGGKDGEAIISLNDGFDISRVRRFEVYNNPNWGIISNINSKSFTHKNLSANTYTYRILDSDGCYSTEAQCTLKQPDKFNAGDTSSTRVTCHVNNTGSGSKTDGTIKVEFSGGIGKYSANVYQGNTDLNKTAIINTNVTPYYVQFDGLAVGTYTVKITDWANKSIETTLKVTSNPEIKLDTTKTHIKCNGDNTGEIKLTVSNDSFGPYTYFLSESDGQESNTFEDLYAGTYTASVTNTNKCKAELKDIKITELDSIKIEYNIGRVSKNGGSDGMISAKISGGTRDYSYICTGKKGYSKNGTTSRDALFAFLPEDNYEIRVTDHELCTNTVSKIKVEDPDILTLVAISTTDVKCKGESTGNVRLLASGGWTPYSYKYGDQPFSSSSSINNLPATSDSVTVIVKDGANITTSIKVKINEPEESLTSSIDSIYHIRCNNDLSGAVKFNISGGNNTSYWVKGINTEWQKGDLLTGLSAGNQTFYVRDANECMVSLNDSIGQPEPLTLTEKQVYDLLCFQDGTGAVKVGMSGGTSPYAISVDKSVWHFDTDSIGHLDANDNQKVWLRDNHSCLDSITVAIAEPRLLTATPIITDLACFGDRSGAITMSVLGGHTPYQISLDSNTWAPGNSVNGLPALTNQDVFIKDNHDCVTKNTVTISQPGKLTTSVASVNHLLCYNDFSGNVTLKIDSGTAPYAISNDSITWVNGNYIDGLYADPAMRLFVKDANECVTEQLVEVTQPDSLIGKADNIYNLLCFEDNTGAIKLDIRGGTTPYQVASDYNPWTPGDSLGHLPAVVDADFYIRDAHMCETSLKATITQPDLLEVTLDSLIPAYCGKKNGYIEVAITGGTVDSTFSFAWQDIVRSKHLIGNDVLNNVYSGQYKVTVTDDHGCQDSLNVAVSDKDGPVLNAWHVDSTSCYESSDGAIYIDKVTGGGGTYSFYLDDKYFPGKIKSDLPGGEHFFRIIDNKLCAYNAYLTVPRPDSIGYKIFKKEPSCHNGNDGSMNVTISGGNGGYQYTWTDGSSDPNRYNISAGTHQLNVVDVLGCTASFDFQLGQPERLLANATIIAPLCNDSRDGRIMIEPMGGTPRYKYSWNTSRKTDVLKNAGAGNYTLRLSDANDCYIDTAFTISSPSPMVINAQLTKPSCNDFADGLISTNVQGGVGKHTYWWSTGVQTELINGLRKGNYSLAVRDANNCRYSENYTLVEPAVLEAESTITRPSCYGYSDGSIAIKPVGGNGGYQYSWSNSSTSANIGNLAIGTYSLTLTDAKNCEFISDYKVTEPAPVALKAQMTSPTCHDAADGKIVLTASGGNGGYKYLWDNNATANSITGIGRRYTVSVTDAKNCLLTSEYKLEAPQAPTARLYRYANVLCTGNSLTLDGGEFESYKWYKDNVLVSEAPDYTVSETGTYLLEMRDAIGCVGKDTFLLEVSDTPLDAVLLLQDSALAKEPIEVVDVTWPVPDSIEWYFDYPISELDSNRWSKEFSVADTGYVNVTLRAWYGGCYSDSSKMIKIYYDADATIPSYGSDGPLILGFKAYPNPNRGDFTAAIELSREATISLLFTHTSSANAIALKKFFGQESYEIPFSLSGLPPGVYVLILTADREQQRLKIVIG